MKHLEVLYRTSFFVFLVFSVINDYRVFKRTAETAKKNERDVFISGKIEAVFSARAVYFQPGSLYFCFGGMAERML